MTRLILILALMLGLVLALRALLGAASRVMAQAEAPGEEGQIMPPIVSKFAYIGLLIVMFGAASGMLGGF